jgi:hypothetical protein
MSNKPDIHKYLNSDFKNTLRSLEAIDEELTDEVRGNKDLDMYVKMLESAKAMFFYKLKSVSDALMIGYGTELEIPEDYSAGIKRAIDPVIVDTEGVLKIVGQAGDTKEAKEVKKLIEAYAVANNK